MKGSIEKLEVGGNWALVFRPEAAEDEPLPVIYVNQARPEDWDGFLPRLAGQMAKGAAPRAMLASVFPTDWNRDFSPWPAAAPHTGGQAFLGKAEERLRLLERVVKPAVDARWATLNDAGNTGLTGYSLGGLAALYALYQSETFGRIGCLSGSLWYEGFMDFQREHAPRAAGARVYLSLGRKEERTRHPLYSRIGQCYRETEALLKERLGGENVRFVLHDGGHGCEVPARMLTGLYALLDPAFIKTSLA